LVIGSATVEFVAGAGTVVDDEPIYDSRYVRRKIRFVDERFKYEGHESEVLKEAQKTHGALYVFHVVSSESLYKSAFPSKNKKKQPDGSFRNDEGSAGNNRRELKSEGAVALDKPNPYRHIYEPVCVLEPPYGRNDDENAMNYCDFDLEIDNVNAADKENPEGYLPREVFTSFVVSYS
jgi:hypothetical protein